MPQGRRKTPFSGKAKKEQLHSKRLKPRRDFGEARVDNSAVNAGENLTDKTEILTNVRLAEDNKGRRRYDLVFQKDSKAEIAVRREKARRPVIRVGCDELQAGVDRFFPESGLLSYPERPKWDSAMSKAKLEANEASHFRQYVENMMRSVENLSYFELNLETWRQLWRVTEMSDILLLIVDARYPSALTPPSLYAKFCSGGDKKIVLVLNKVDLIPAGLAIAWKSYFEAKFPGIRVAFFTSCPSYNLRKPNALDGEENVAAGARRLRGKISMAKEGALQVFGLVDEIVAGRVDLSPWRQKIVEFRDGGGEENEDGGEVSAPALEASSKFVTLGMVGHPNVGKSSLINSLVGRRVVSVSKTPGHTKHFQTIFICPTVRLCDCPGLVFPSLVPRSLQVVIGSYPIAQTQEQMSVVQYLAERLDLVKILKLDVEDEDTSLSAFDICERWAEKRGYATARSNRPDVARAANHILRMALEGRIMLALVPPGYQSEDWAGHADVAVIKDLLAITGENSEETREDFDVSSCESEDEEAESEDVGSVVAHNKFGSLASDSE